MASSTVKGLQVEITANLTGLVSGINQAESKLKSFGSRVDKFGRSLRNTFSTLFAVGATTGAFVAPFVSFQAEMNRVKAISGLTGAEFDKVKAKALDLGKTTELSATEAAKGFVQLFKKGQTLTEALSGIDTVLSLVTVGELEAADAAKIASAAFKVFGKTGETFVSLGDKMAKASVASGIDIKDFALLMSKAGNTAVNAGVGFSELSAAFAVLRNNAVEASEAATSLRNIMQRASGRSAKALKELADLKIDFFDSSGQFIGFAKAMEMFNRATQGLDPKRIGDLSETLFGSRAADKILGLAAAADDIERLTAVVDNSQGTLDKFRDSLLKGLVGSLILAGSSIKNMAISLVEQLEPDLIVVTDKVKEFANEIEKLSPTTKKAIGYIAGIGGAALIATVAMGTLVAAFKLLYIGAILTAMKTFVFWIGAKFTAAILGTEIAALGLGGTLKLIWAGALAPMLKFAGVLLLIPAAFLAVIVVIEKTFKTLDDFFKGLIKLVFKAAAAIAGALSNAFFELFMVVDDLRGSGLDKVLGTIGVNADDVGNILLKLSGKVRNVQVNFIKSAAAIDGALGPLGKMAEGAKETRIEMLRLIEETTGFSFKGLGELIFGGGDDTSITTKKEEIKGVKTEVFSLMEALKGLSSLFGEAFSADDNSSKFTSFMKGVGDDLEEYKKRIGTVQQQVSQIIVSSIQAMASGIGDIFAKTIVDGQSFFKSAKDLMKSFARQFISQVVAMIAQLLILAATQALVNLVQEPISGQAKNASAMAGAGSFAAGAASFVSGLANLFTTDSVTAGSGKSQKTFGNDFGEMDSSKKAKTEQTIILELDGRQITKTVVKNMPSVVRTGSGVIRSS